MGEASWWCRLIRRSQSTGRARAGLGGAGRTDVTPRLLALALGAFRGFVVQALLPWAAEALAVGAADEVPEPIHSKKGSERHRDEGGPQVFAPVIAIAEPSVGESRY